MKLSDDFISQLQNLMQQVQTLLPPTPASIDWQQTLACRWRTLANKAI
jgi:predicted AAA+ superfamily ATPase